MLERIQAGLGAAECPDQRRLREAASGFEALLLAQLLKAMREERGWMGTGEDQASASMLEIAEEHLAEVLARAGGLGLSELVLRGLSSGGCAPEAAP
jgi:Rod binding domain-containing protein